MSRGYNFAKIVERVADLLEMPVDEVLSAGKQRQCVKARSMVSYWVSAMQGMNQTALARKFSVPQPAFCTAARNGEMIVKEN